MPKPADNNRALANAALRSCLYSLSNLDPKAVLDALDAHADHFQALRTECEHALNAVHDQKISNA